MCRSILASDKSSCITEKKQVVDKSLPSSRWVVFCRHGTYFCSLTTAGVSLLDLVISTFMCHFLTCESCNSDHIATLGCAWRNSLRECTALPASWPQNSDLQALAQRSSSPPPPLIVVEAVACPCWMSFTLSKSNPFSFTEKSGTPASQLDIMEINEPKRGWGFGFFVLLVLWCFIFVVGFSLFGGWVFSLFALVC